MLTITTSQLAAVFARKLEAQVRPGARRRKDRLTLRRVMTPRFSEVSSLQKR